MKTDDKQLENLIYNIYETPELEQYFLQLHVGDKVVIGFEIGEISVKDGCKYVEAESGVKFVYDPHLDPIFEGKYNSIKEKKNEQGTINSNSN